MLICGWFSRWSPYFLTGGDEDVVTVSVVVDDAADALRNEGGVPDITYFLIRLSAAVCLPAQFSSD
jgi:hypothetical protein